MKEKYNPTLELKVNIESEEARYQINEGIELFNNFYSRFNNQLDLKNISVIPEIYNKAISLGIFSKANQLRSFFFSRDIHFYGVCYLWDKCINDCLYCPGGLTNRKKALKQDKRCPNHEMNVEQAVRDVSIVKQNGHEHICLLAGSSPGRDKLPDKLINYLKAIDNLGFKEIILNIEPPTLDGLKKIRNAIVKTSVQFRIFQETYDLDSYRILHPSGPKADYHFRKNSQLRALEAGFDNYGLGVLFGLHRFPLEEIKNLIEHASEIKTITGKVPARICLPSANELSKIGVNIPFFLPRGKYGGGREIIIKKGPYEMVNELLYALTRLAFSSVNIVSSERDGPAMLRILDDYATCTTLNVQSGVGGNCKLFEKSKPTDIHFEQTTDFPRDPKKAILDYKERGFNPIINFKEFPSNY